MSFRKRSEVIGTPGAVPGRTPPGQGPVPVVGRGPPVPLGGGQIPGRTIPGRTPTGRAPISGRTPASNKVAVEEISNPGIRSSLITSQPTISTGTADLDKLLGHHGLPLGHSLLIEESGTTDFGAILLRVFASQGIIQNRIIEKTVNCHVIVVGVNQEWGKQLPGIYKGSTKEKKKAAIKANETAISVSNLSQQSARESDLKIAWRYGLNKKAESEGTEEVNENYNHQFDITERLRPVPDSSEISFVPLNDYTKMISNIKDIINHQLKNKSRTIRIIIPNLLIPSIYTPTHSQPTFIIPFFHSLRSLLKQFSTNVSMVVSLPIDLYPRSSTITSTLEQLSDSVINLQPFNQKLVELIEKAYRNEPSKIQHGYVNILKLPVLSERGLMTIHQHEYAFKNGRKKFEIEPWGIPVEVDEEESQTTKNIDF